MKKEVLHFQELTNKAWKARDLVLYKGWIVRLSEGVTKRANSVLPLAYSGTDLEHDIAAVEKLYNNNNLPLIFQIPDYYEPSNLTETLLDKGFRMIDETIVMAMAIEQLNYEASMNSYDYLIEENVNEKWFQSLYNLTKMDSTKLEGFRRIISRTSNQKITCSVLRDDLIIGIVLGLIDNEYIGIYDLNVHSNYRRKHVGEFIMRKMLSYAQINNLKTMYLQVEAKNTPAIFLYNKLNFREKYRYRYFVKKEE